jgi:hypothetical protein
MKAKVLTLVAVLLGGLVAVGGVGCTGVVVARPAPVEVVHVQTAPPARVYHGGRWLHYRGTGYYYYDRGAWLVAPAVPAHVVHYHRPVHVTHHRHVVPHHRTYVRPSHRHHRKAETAFDKGTFADFELKPLG